jgi:hypothetical protein
VLLSAAPASLLGDVRIARPRRNRTAEDIAAIRNEIDNKINGADQQITRR